MARYLEGGFDPARLTISSDGGGCLPQFDARGELTKMDFASSQALAQVLKAMLERGLPLQTVLPMITLNVATLLKLGAKGRLASGAGFCR